MEHHFNIELAKQYGILEAVLLNNLYFWIIKNKANNTNYFDGSYWTYNSIKAFAELFPYASEKQIRAALKKLVEAGILKTGNYNKSSYDRTLWYALTEKGISIFPNGQMENTKKENGSAEKGEPIPYIKPDDKPNKKPNNTIDQKVLETEFSELWAIYPKRQGKANALRAYIKARNSGVDKDTIQSGITAYRAFLEANKTKPKYIKQGSTWFNQHCWEDDYSIDGAKSDKEKDIEKEWWAEL